MNYLIAGGESSRSPAQSALGWVSFTSATSRQGGSTFNRASLGSFGKG